MNAASGGVSRWRQRVIDCALVFVALMVSYRAFKLVPAAGGSWEPVILHLILLAFFVALSVLLLALPARGVWVRPAGVVLLVAVAMILAIYNLIGIVGRITHAPYLTVPFIADIFCAGSFDWKCARRYPSMASALFAVAAIFFLFFWFFYAALRQRATQLLGVMAKPFGRRGELWARAVLLTLCGFYIMWQAAAWDDFVEREPIQLTFFRQFEIGPVEMVTGPSAVYTPIAPASKRPRPLVLIVVDALRGDKVGLVPGSATLTPFLRSLAAAGRLHRFEPAYSTCTYSYCGIAAILASASWATQQRGRPIPINEVLHGAGYRSYFLLGGIHRDSVYLTRLYGDKVVVLRDDQDRPIPKQSDDYALIDELAGLALPDPARSFIFIHLLSTHIAGKKRDVHGEPSTYGWDFIDQNFKASSYAQTYDRGVAQADDVIRQIFAELDRRGLLEEAVVAITADHGERLDPRRMLGHGGEPDAQVSRVPLLIYDAKAPIYPDHPIASQLDVAPTLLATIGLSPPRSWDGIILQNPNARMAVPVDSRLRAGAAIAGADGPMIYACEWRSGREIGIAANGDELVGPRHAEALGRARALFSGVPKRRERQCPGRH